MIRWMLTRWFRPNAYGSRMRLVVLRYLSVAVRPASLGIILISLPARRAGLQQLAAQAKPLVISTMRLPDGVAATAAAVFPPAALFSPLYDRLQRGIGRRFYRSKSDAEKVLVSFSQQVRDEVVLDHLCSHLAEMVIETVQPVEVSIWLIPRSADTGSRRV